MSGYMKKPCEHCPYRKDVPPFLHPRRGAELAYLAYNHYNSFPCHKTTKSADEVFDGDYPEEFEGERFAVETSKECAGFLTLKAQACGEDRIPEGFEPSYDLIYESPDEMAEAYENQ